MTSIRVRLLTWLVGPILAVNLALGALAYLLAWTPARIAFDQDLADGAAALAARLPADPAALERDLGRLTGEAFRPDAVDAVTVAVRDSHGKLLAGDPATPQVQPAPGVHPGQLHGEAVRVAGALTAGAARQVVVAKTMRRLEGSRWTIVRVLLLVETLFTVGLAGLIWFSVTNGLAPLGRMRAELNARGGERLEPLPADVPFELVPMVAALNDLLERVRSGARAQHDFLADMAHQLRTPLAGLRTQLEWLRAGQGDPAQQARSLDLMLLSTERMIRHTNQLLALARAEPSQFEAARLEPVDLAQLVSEAVQDFVERAAARRIDLGFDLAPTVVLGDRFLLRDLIDNLVDNALRYTPEGGVVNVKVQRDGERGVLRVDDTGPGIPASRRDAVFQRFVRLDEKTTGSGLGLAIVRDIARVHGATLDLDDAPGGGAVFTLGFKSV
ncbi:MAG TPA: ATP-binding protein [Telluria sp.]|nr:ATP-binding protein [Telluria sp.]